MALDNTHYGAAHITEMLRGAKKLFFAGIGGVSMCSLARISRLRGYEVSGYDRAETPVTRALEEAGITVYYTADAAHVRDCDLLVYTVAMPRDNPEYAEAMRLGIPCVSRADYLGCIMSGYGCRIGISGMHGKSTTTSMTAKLFADAGLDPTVSCGAHMKDAGSEYRIGSEDYFIFEACEYMDSFLDFYPTAAIILNIEMDHVDYFHSMEQIRSSFAAFLDKAKDGWALVNCCDDDVLKAAEGYTGRLVTFGVEAKDADYRAESISFSNGRGSFDFYCRSSLLCRISLAVPGAHFVCDALAAAAAAHLCGIAPDVIASSLSSFEGAGRRMDNMGKALCGADIYSDYAHHPTEIAATLEAARQMCGGKVFCLFQPHTYSRTSELFDSFARALAHGGIYEAILSPIYSARETETFGVSSEKLCRAVSSLGGSCRYADSFQEAAQYLNSHASAGDMLLVMGAGDITKVIPYLKGDC